jgi:hypothetical protein
MTFNALMACMLLVALALFTAGYIRNMSPACKDKTRWGWFVLAFPIGAVPVVVAIYRGLTV